MTIIVVIARGIGFSAIMALATILSNSPQTNASPTTTSSTSLVTTTTIVPTSTVSTIKVETPQQHIGIRPPEYVDEQIMTMWNKVAWCESHGNWSQVHFGSRSFSGALGIRNDVWLEHGGAEFGNTAGNATPREQVIIARRIQARGGIPNYVPDQNGECHGW